MMLIQARSIPRSGFDESRRRGSCLRSSRKGSVIRVRQANSVDIDTVMSIMITALREGF